MVHSSLQIISKSTRFLGCLLETRSFSSLHRIKVWRLARPLHDLNVLLLEPLFCFLGTATFNITRAILTPFPPNKNSTWNMGHQFTKTTFMIFLSSSSHGHNEPVLHGKELSEQYAVCHKLTAYGFGVT